MGSSSKRRTTFAKLNREQKLREKRYEKQARKEARKQDADAQPAFGPANAFGPEDFADPANLPSDPDAA